MEDFKFSTLEYKRPDFEKTGAFAEEITEKIKNAASYGELKGYMEQMEEMSKNFSTDCTIASIRHTLDTTDEFYEKEDAYINDMVPTVMPKLLAMNDALMESKFRGDIENEYEDFKAAMRGAALDADAEGRRYRFVDPVYGELRCQWGETLYVNDAPMQYSGFDNYGKLTMQEK